MNRLDNYLNTLGQQRNDRLTGSLRDALQVNPDDYAKTVRLAKAAGVEVEAVPLYADVAQEAQYLEGIGFRTLWKDSPKTAEFLSDSGNARLAHDDVANLSGFETALHYLGNGGRALASGLPAKDSKFNRPALLSPTRRAAKARQTFSNRSISSTKMVAPPTVTSTG